MDDHTGEYTGELIFEGRAVARVLGTNYENSNEESDPNLRGRFRGRSVAVPSTGRWALDDFESTDAPSEYVGVSRALLFKVLKATRDTMVEDDTASPSLKQIVVRAGLTSEESTRVVMHFPTGDLLACLLMSEIHTPLFKDLSRAAIEEGPVLERVFTIATRYARRVCTDIHFYQHYTDLWSACSPPPGASMALLETVYTIDRQGVQVVAALLAEGQMEGDVREGDPFLLSRVLVGSLYGILRTLGNPARLTSAGIYSDDLIEEAITVLIDGLRRR